MSMMRVDMFIDRGDVYRDILFLTVDAAHVWARTRGWTIQEDQHAIGRHFVTPDGGPYQRRGFALEQKAGLFYWRMTDYKEVKSP